MIFKDSNAFTTLVLAAYSLSSVHLTIWLIDTLILMKKASDRDLWRGLSLSYYIVIITASIILCIFNYYSNYLY